MTVARMRPEAQADFVQRSRYCRREGGEPLADRFALSARSAIRTIESLPGAGSPRFADPCHVPGLRSWTIEGFPCGWFYVVHDSHLDVVRLLSFSQDLPAILGWDDAP